MDAVKEPVVVEWMGTKYEILLANNKIHNMSVFESLDHPGHGPARRIHHREDEAFFPLSGEGKFRLAGSTRFYGPDEVVFVPMCVGHSFRKVGNLSAGMLTVMTQDGFEGYFVDVSPEQPFVSKDISASVEIGTHFHLTFISPPLGMH